jgi:hypothetical protein
MGGRDQRDGAGDRRECAERGGTAVVAIADLGRERSRRRRREPEGGERDRRVECGRAIRRIEDGENYVFAM